MTTIDPERLTSVTTLALRRLRSGRVVAGRRWRRDAGVRWARSFRERVSGRVAAVAERRTRAGCCPVSPSPGGVGAGPQVDVTWRAMARDELQ